MDTSLSWIKAYVPDLSCSAQEYTDAMTLSGTKVEGYKEFDKNLDKIISSANKIAVKIIFLLVRIKNSSFLIISASKKEGYIFIFLSSS